MHNRWLLPDGIEEIPPQEAAAVEAVRRATLDLFARWGYELVITPHVEFLESLLCGVGPDIDLQTFKVTDPISGRQMGFRADITPQVARLDAHQLGREGPSRLCYSGNVLHARPRAAGAARCPIQIGAELYGDASLHSDLEVISLMLETLQVAGIRHVHMDLGHVGIYRELAAAAGLGAETEAAVFDALQRKARDELQGLTAGLGTWGHMLNELGQLCGDRAVFVRARQVLAEAPAPVQAALNDLEALAVALSQRYPELPLYFDLGELRGYHYHTGMVFAAFVPGVGHSIARGGRYDSRGADYGRARPATGFSTDLKTLVSGDFVWQQQPVAIWAPVSGAGLWEQISALRAAGQRVIQALPGQTLADAVQVGCTQRLSQESGTWQLLPLSL